MREEQIAAHNAERTIIVSSAIISVVIVFAAVIFAYFPGTFPAQSSAAVQEEPAANNTPTYAPTGGGCGVQ